MKELLLAVAEEITKIRHDYEGGLSHADTCGRVGRVVALFLDTARTFVGGTVPTAETVRAFHATLDARFRRDQET